MKKVTKVNIENEILTEEHVRKKKKKLPIVLISISGVIVALFIFVVCFYFSKLGLIQRDDPTTSTAIGSIDENNSQVRDEASEMEHLTSGLDERDVILSDNEIFKDDDVYNILLIGTDDRTSAFSDFARGDSCMLLSINKKSGKLKLVSFERGMGVPILDGDYKGQYDWLTHTFAYGGAKLMLQEIRECFRVDVDRYVRVNLNTFIKGIDAIGGVDIELTEAEAQYLRNVRDGDTGEFGYNYDVHAGLNHLTGYPALSYARCRKIDSDWQRIGRQRTVVQAAITKVRQLNLFELNALADQILPLIKTNLTDAEITHLIPAILGVKGIADQMTIPADGTFGSMHGMGDRSMFSPDFDQNAEILKKFIYELN